MHGRGRAGPWIYVRCDEWKCRTMVNGRCDDAATPRAAIPKPAFQIMALEKGACVFSSKGAMRSSPEGVLPREAWGRRVRQSQFTRAGMSFLSTLRPLIGPLQHSHTCSWAWASSSSPASPPPSQTRELGTRSRAAAIHCSFWLCAGRAGQAGNGRARRCQPSFSDSDLTN